MVQIVGILCKHGHMRIHTRIPRNTTLHHPSMHSDNDTDRKHNTSRQFRTHLDQSRNCLYLLSRMSGCALLNLCWSTKEWVVVALGRRRTWRLWRATCRRASRRVPSPKTVKQQCSSTCCGIKRRDPSPRCVGGVERRLTPGLLDEIREFIEEEHGRISVKSVSNRFTLSRTSSRKAIRCLRLRPLVIRTVPHLEDRHIRDRRKFAEEMLARLAIGSGRRVSRKIS